MGMSLMQVALNFLVLFAVVGGVSSLLAVLEDRSKTRQEELQRSAHDIIAAAQAQQIMKERPWNKMDHPEKVFERAHYDDESIMELCNYLTSVGRHGDAQKALNLYNDGDKAALLRHVKANGFNGMAIPKSAPPTEGTWSPPDWVKSGPAYSIRKEKAPPTTGETPRRPGLNSTENGWKPWGSQDVAGRKIEGEDELPPEWLPLLTELDIEFFRYLCPALVVKWERQLTALREKSEDTFVDWGSSDVITW